MHAFFDGLRAPLHIAHRGGAGLYPENTMLAFEAAVSRHRTQLIELDVHASADGEIVVFHDDEVDRTTNGSGPIRALTWAEIAALDAGHGLPGWAGRGATVPRLVEVLRAFPELPLNLEIKPDRPELAGPVVALLEAEGALDRVCLGSFHDSVGEALVEAAPAACHYYPQQALTQFVMSALMGQTPADDPRYSVLDMPMRHNGMQVLTPAVVAAARALGKWINVWTIDARADMDALLAMGVGGIMTDRPDVLREALDAWAAR